MREARPPEEFLPEALELLIRLHGHKTVGYGDAWRKRGELLSIFTNLARKYDRLIVALDNGVRASDELLADTAGDLCVYAGKYLTWLAERQPEAFDAVSRGTTSAQCADDQGPGALAHVLRALEVRPAADVGDAWRRLKRVFGPLDAGLVAQSEGRSNIALLTWDAKVELAWDVAAASAALLVALAQEDPVEWAAWRGEIEELG